MRNEALVIVDFQYDFYAGSLPVPDAIALAAPIAQHADRFRQAGNLVVCTKDWHPVNHCSFIAQGGPFPPHCIAGTDGSELHPYMRDLNAPVVYKGFDPDDDPAMNAFAGVVKADDGTEDFISFTEYLHNQGIEKVHIVGLTKEYCVPATAKGALDSGFEVVVATPFTKAIDPEAGREAMRELSAAGVTVV